MHRRLIQAVILTLLLYLVAGTSGLAESEASLSQSLQDAPTQILSFLN